MASDTLQKSYVLTVSESKRLIARGVAKCEPVQRALEKGILAVAKGTTNGYVVEEITGEGIEKPLYCAGTTRPTKGRSEVRVTNELPDLVLRCGEPMEGLSAIEAVGEMGPGDVFVKGANALNYDLRQVGILVGHPTGGTIGATIGSLVARRATLLTPVGLEKSIPGDLCQVARKLTQAAENGSGPTLWPIMEGEIFTELEAMRTLCQVEACPIGAGGILGAEGSVWIGAWGSAQQLQEADALIDAIQGEPAFGAD